MFYLGQHLHSSLPGPISGVHDLFRRASLVAQTVKNLPVIQETLVRPLVGKMPWRRKKQPTPVFLPRKFHGQRSLVDHSPWGRKESDTTEQLTFTYLDLLIWYFILLKYKIMLSIQQLKIIKLMNASFCTNIC